MDQKSRGWKKYPSNSDYMISTDGKVMSLCYNYRGLILKPLLSHGYLRVALNKDGERKMYEIHKLVLETYVGPRPKGHICNHKDGIKSNNDVDNLEWVTHSKNLQHAYSIGLQMPQQGEKNGRAKLTTVDVLEIRRLYEEGYKVTKLGRMYGVRHQTIGRIVRYEGWKNV